MNHPFENMNPRPEQEDASKMAMTDISGPELEERTEHLGGVTYTRPPGAEPDTVEGRSEPGIGHPPQTVYGVEAEVRDMVEVPEDLPESTSEPEHKPGVSVSEVEGDHVVVAGRDATLAPTTIRYQQGPTLLRSREIVPNEIPSEQLFVHAGVPDDIQGGVYVLIGSPNSGRRTAARRLLGSLPEGRQLRKFRRPDWDEPDMDRIPNDPDHGYLLDLTGMGEALPDHFAEDLASHAKKAWDNRTLLVILGDEGVKYRLSPSDGEAGLVVREHQRPDALVVARKRIRATGHHEREAWLDAEGGPFHGLVAPDAPPSRGVELAEAVLKAEHQQDEVVLDEFTGWQKQIQEWFAADVRREDATGAEQRALRIASAFLDGSPAPAVLNAADALLPQAVRDRFEVWGGALAAPDDETRCSDAGVGYQGGRISITDSREGLDKAVIRYLWNRRGSASALLSTWLSEISAPGGPAGKCLDRLSEVLTEVAVAQGSATVLALLEGWLKQDVQQRMGFVVKVLERLTEHPGFGARVRVVDLRNWAKGGRTPERQRAVIEVCRGGFAESYPEQALMRLRYVMETTDDPGLRREAVAAIAEQLAPERGRMAVLKTLVDWVENDRTTIVGGRLFLDLFGGAGFEGEGIRDDPSRGLLTLIGSEGEAAVELFKKAWKLTWNKPELRSDTSHALVAWRRAADAEHMPVDRTRRIIGVVFGSSGIDDDLDRIIRGEGQLGTLLRRDFMRRP